MNNPPSLAGRGSHRDLAKERDWRDLLKQFAASGQTVRDFCAGRRIKETAFYFWRREIQHRDGCAPARRLVGSVAPRPLTFAQVLVQPPRLATSQEGLRLALGGGRQLLLPASMAVEQVAKLVHAIEGVA